MLGFEPKGHGEVILAEISDLDEEQGNKFGVS